MKVPRRLAPVVSTGCAVAVCVVAAAAADPAKSAGRSAVESMAIGDNSGTSAQAGLSIASPTSALDAKAVGAVPQAPAKYSIVTSAPFLNPDGVQSHGSVDCPSGTVAWSGGVSGDSTSLGQNINSSYPTISNGDAVGWVADVNNTSGADSSFVVYAVCAARPSGLNYVVVSKTFPVGPNSDATGEVPCPMNANGKQLLPIGGGAFGFSRNPGQNIQGDFPIGDRWRVDMVSDLASSFTVYAVCAKPPASYTTTIQRFYAALANSQTVASASCPLPGETLVGGGGSPGGLPMRATYPSSSNTWTVSVNNPGNVNRFVYVYAVCVAPAIPGPPSGTDYLLAAGTFPWPYCCGGDAHVWVNAWIDPRRDWVPGFASLVPDTGSGPLWGGVVCLNVQGHEAAVVVNFDPWAYYKLVLRDNARKPDEVISFAVLFAPGCDFTPGQPAQWTFDGDVNIHDAVP
jgi:hypothetical protein